MVAANFGATCSKRCEALWSRHSDFQIVDQSCRTECRSAQYHQILVVGTGSAQITPVSNDDVVDVPAVPGEQRPRGVLHCDELLVTACDGIADLNDCLAKSRRFLALFRLKDSDYAKTAPGRLRHEPFPRE